MSLASYVFYSLILLRNQMMIAFIDFNEVFGVKKFEISRGFLFLFLDSSVGIVSKSIVIFELILVFLLYTKCFARTLPFDSSGLIVLAY